MRIKTLSGTRNCWTECALMAIHDFRGAVEQRQANASIIRQTDVMRQGVAATIIEIRPSTAVVVSEDEFVVGESVKLELRNAVQRYRTKVRGEVRSVQQHRGEFTIEFSLLNRLNPHDVLTLRMQIRSPTANRWV